MSISGSGWGSAGKVVASDTRGPRFESSRLRSFYWTLLVVSYVEKTIIKKKRPGMGHLKKKLCWSLDLNPDAQVSVPTALPTLP